MIVKQKRDEYNKKSWFGKAVAKLQGNSFDKTKDQITQSARRKVDRMTPEEVLEFVENEERLR